MTYDVRLYRLAACQISDYERYDSDPPFGNETHDYGLTVGLSWSH